ncbi:hypothetical protein KC331_g3384 [Hortaea werneckii]|uniref:Long chronological lifespan protein 2 n=1 Tax=Hortaea werneckii TaxID=91943 RepID=A0A3M7CHE1_HORWE|nr:hypothetical protein KC331_g3384 [Hortaea werneckii]KAI7719245.1 hypothetical protein KC353_g3141 [Hortaea werneckii]RMY51558.1 hypothetical protein D0865_06271 [Hortaea werneckii]
MHLLNILTPLLLLILPATAQFQFFEHMFGGGGGGPQQPPQNAASDSSWYQAQYENARCDKYLCPHTLSCVHFPHHCPCAFPAVEDKVELGDGSMICASKGGWSQGEAGRKIELARKGLL